MRFSYKRNLFRVLIYVLVSICIVCSSNFAKAEKLYEISIANAPFVDASMSYLGETDSIFKKYSLKVNIIDSNWANQFDLVVSGAADFALASLDQIVARAGNLEKLNSSIAFVLPTWQFVGLGYYTKQDYHTLEYYLNKANEKLENFPALSRRVAYNEFLTQFKGKKIALTEGTVFEHGFSSLVDKSGLEMSDFIIVNTSPSAGLNGLEDRNVGLASVGYQQWPEAERRGYKRAISAENIDVIIITGYFTKKSFAEKNPDILKRFAHAWFEIANIFSKKSKHAFEIIVPRLEKRGATPISFNEFQTISLSNIIPLSPVSSAKLFLDPSSPAFWEKAWFQAAENLADTGKSDAIPLTTDSFIANEVLKMLINSDVKQP